MLQQSQIRLWLCMQRLKEEPKQPAVVILQQPIFYNIFILCLWLSVIRRSDQGVLLMKFPSQIYFNDINHSYRAAILKKIYLRLLPFYVAAATYCYYENMHRTILSAIVSYLLKCVSFFLFYFCNQNIIFIPVYELCNVT